MSSMRISFSNEKKISAGVSHVPASKSISNRVLLIRALCTAPFQITNLAEATDTKIMQQALLQLAQYPGDQTIDVRDAGTAFRFLTAFLAQHFPGSYFLRGSERMHQRPIAALVESLQSLGADIHYVLRNGYPPLRIQAKKLMGGEVSISAFESSQYISALCLIAPVLSEGLKIHLEGDIVSFSYVQMTLKLMRHFGVQHTMNEKTISIPQQAYQPVEFRIENDWSSAVFFYAVALLLDETEIVLPDFFAASMQGDAFIAAWADDFGIESHFVDGNLKIIKRKSNCQTKGAVYDMTDYPDMAIPLIVACAVAYPQIRFCGLSHLQYKESDRIVVLQKELAKFGYSISFTDGILHFDERPVSKAPLCIRVETHADHRIAMSMSLMTLKGFIVELDDATCVSKSFPDFFLALQELGFHCETI